MELLAPAGSPEALDAAVGEGADAVYLGLKDFNARLRSANFTYGQFENALRSLHKMGKKVYVTVNTVFEQRESDRMYQLLEYLASRKPDALIVQDFGVVAMARAYFPSLRLHASTQMNIASSKGVNAMSRHGISRVVLARELSLEELQSIRAETNTELEVFVHGALCISASGLCLFSSFLGGKSANRGMCTQACRRLYRQPEGQGGYYFSPNDLQLLEHLPALASAGINSVKIEGRMKSASYVGVVVSAYRLVLDAIANGDDSAINRASEILRNDFARPKTQYYFNGKRDINWLNPQQDGGTGIPLGEIHKVKGTGTERRALVKPRQRLTLSVRDSVRIHRRDDSGRITHKLSTVKPAEAGSCWISAPEGEIGDSVYLIQTKAAARHYAPVIADNVSSRGPGRKKAPLPQVTLTQKKEDRHSEIFPEGIYVAAARIEDLYIIQSVRPQRVMLALTQKNINYLLADDKPPLPFKSSEIILTLDPYFSQNNLSMQDGVNQLTEKGYRQYLINNPGHFSLFGSRDMRENIRLIAGPWLYMFNSWALSFISSHRVDAFVSPLENNRQNLERTLEKCGFSQSENRLKKPALHSKFFITVFSYPPLFNIRTNLAPFLDFDAFTDNKDEQFILAAGENDSRVYPQNPFSIIDKIPFLQEAGLKHFIIDLSGRPFKKSDYRNLMRMKGMPNSNRFNWKNGFFNP